VTAIITRGDAAHLHLPDETVDLVVTSPPYFGLRSYTDGGEHYEGQVGDEATPAEYLDALTACTAEWMRVLKPGGSIFVNLGDKYSGAQQQNTGRQSAEASSDYWRKTNPKATGIPAKSLMGFPWRYALRCIDDLGLILRAEIVWAKPNGLPESVTDRVRRSHEQVFHFVKQPRYYSAVDEVREQYSETKSAQSMREWQQSLTENTSARTVHRDQTKSGGQSGLKAASLDVNPLGKLPGSVWTIATAPLSVPDHVGVDHFAAYPPELVRRVVLGWSPREVCTACGEGRRPVAKQVNDEYAAARRAVKQTTEADFQRHVGRSSGATASAISNGLVRPDYRITGYGCACPDTTAPATPGIVLDPFAGTGTTMLVASVLGRVGIGTDLSLDYCRLAQWRVNDPGERARVLGVPKPDKPVEGQLGLFEGIA
jgi:DNA modification methylase